MDMISSFRKLLLTGKQQSVDKIENTLSTLNVDAGGEILSHYQTEWVEIHTNNETNAEKAAELATSITTIHDEILRQNNNMVKINQLLTSTPTLLNTIVTCNEQITELYRFFEQVEHDLSMFEDLLEEEELQARKQAHLQQLAVYEQKRIANLEVKRMELIAKHTETINELEKKQQLILQERQQVFQDAFKVDLEMYKNCGTLPKRVAKNQSGALLEEIQIDTDDKELLEFLEEK